MAKKMLALGVAALTAFSILYSIQESQNDENIFTKNLQSVFSYGQMSSTQQCTQALAVECVSDIEQTVKACSKAFETHGSDIIADIRCAKDLMADKKHCWPCICYEAQQRGWHIIGC